MKKQVLASLAAWKAKAAEVRTTGNHNQDPAELPQKP